MHKRTTSVMAISVVVFSCFAVWHWNKPLAVDVDQKRTNSVTVTKDLSSSEPTKTPLDDKSSQLPYTSRHGALVSSLKGIYFDRDLAVDEQGNLRISSDIKDVFDFFFSAIEEEELDVVLARIEEYLNYKLEDPALTQALKALADYVDYKAAVYDLEAAFSEKIASFSATGQQVSLGGEYLSLVKERSELVKQLRQEHLSVELHEAFYSEREQYDDYMLQKLQINADPALSPSQKQASLKILDSQMPRAFIESRQSANPVALLREATQSASESDPEALYVQRVSTVGEPVAQRLSELDAERAKWTSRYNDYSVKRDAIIGNTGLDKESQLNEINVLRQQLFSETEQVRVASLDQINNVF